MIDDNVDKLEVIIVSSLMLSDLTKIIKQSSPQKSHFSTCLSKSNVLYRMQLYLYKYFTFYDN